jgi:hypothetical protein
LKELEESNGLVLCLGLLLVLYFTYYQHSFLDVGKGLYFILRILLVFSSPQSVMNEFNPPDKNISLNLKVLGLSLFSELTEIHYPRGMESVEIHFILLMLESEGHRNLALCTFLFINR